MTRIRLWLWLWLMWALAGVGSVMAAEPEPSKAEPPTPIAEHYQLINDRLGVLRISTAIDLTHKLQALEKHNGTQIVFLSVPSVGPEGLLAYARRVANQWDIGNNGQGNGVLFLVSQNDGAWILTGPGIQGALPDVKVARIFREIVDPRWAKGEFSEGVEAAVLEMIKAAEREDSQPTFYDYLKPFRALGMEHVLIILLSACGMGYAAFLVWSDRRIQQRKAERS